MNSSIGKKSACNAGDPGLIPWSGRSPREGNGNPPQYSCLENSMDRGAWQTTVHGFTRVRHDLVTKPTTIIPWIFKKILYWPEEARHKRVWFCLYETLENTNKCYNNKNHYRDPRKLLGEMEVFYCDGEYKCVQHCQNSSKRTLKMCAYCCIRLYINKM